MLVKEFLQFIMLFHPPVYFGVCIIITIYTPVPEEVSHVHMYVGCFSGELTSYDAKFSTGGVE